MTHKLTEAEWCGVIADVEDALAAATKTLDNARGKLELHDGAQQEEIAQLTKDCEHERAECESFAKSLNEAEANVARLTKELEKVTAERDEAERLRKCEVEARDRYCERLREAEGRRGPVAVRASLAAWMRGRFTMPSEAAKTARVLADEVERAVDVSGEVPEVKP